MNHLQSKTATRPRLRRAPALRAALFACALLLPLAARSAGDRETAVDGATAPARMLAGRDDVERFIDRVAAEHGFARSTLENLIGPITPDPKVLALIDPPPSPASAPSWHAYRQRFTNRTRVRAGVRFWFRHEAAIARASARYGVPGEIIVGIIGVETIYGRYTGGFRVVDALATLAFDFPRRADFFARELEQFLLYARESGLDPASLRGSYAGAIGLPQFMPSSIRHYAVDFDGDGRIDLAGSPEDAIGSVANFLAEHGWRRGEPTHFRVRFARDAQIDPLLAAGIEPNFELAELARHGVHTDNEAARGMRLALIDLPNAGEPPSYALGARNFYVITRYNRSSFYAMAVIELGRAVRDAREREIRRAARG